MRVHRNKMLRLRRENPSQEKLFSHGVNIMLKNFEHAATVAVAFGAHILVLSAALLS